jgi:hypothetical protein
MSVILNWNLVSTDPLKVDASDWRMRTKLTILKSKDLLFFYEGNCVNCSLELRVINHGNVLTGTEHK